MNYRSTKFLLLVLLSLSLFGASAQDAGDAWRILLYDMKDSSILTITPDGITETQKLPDDVDDIRLSSTGSYVATVTYADDPYSETPYANEIYLYDIETEQCCRLLVSQESFAAISEGNSGGFYLGGFNEDDTMFALNYYFSVDTGSDAYGAWIAGIAVVDVATGDIIATRQTTERFAGWYGEGIATASDVTARPGDSPDKYIEHEVHAWNPLTDEWLPTGRYESAIPYYGTVGRSELLVTGEHITSSFLSVPDNDPSYTFDFPYVLYSNGTEAYPVWISYPALGEGIGSPRDSIGHWISDGRYIYNRTGAYNSGEFSDVVEILARDGEIHRVEVPDSDQFVAGTPEGWLAKRISQPEPPLIHYTYDGETLQSEVIMTLSANTRIISKPQLGHSLDRPAPFPEVVPQRPCC
jgi:hypothetical protein